MKYFLNNCFINIKNQREYFNAIQNTLKGSDQKCFFYLNSYSFYLTQTSKDFNTAFNNADFIIADGYGIVFAFKILKKVKFEKVVFTYSFAEGISQLLVAKKQKVYLIGAKPNIIKSAASILKSNYNLNIVGFSHGYFDNSQQENIMSKIREAAPDVLICGMGMPKSELWIEANKRGLGIKCIFSVGGFFDFLTNNKASAPIWLHNTGLEWLFRLIQEPVRLFRRYFISNTFLLYFIIKSRIKQIFTEYETFTPD